MAKNLRWKILVILAVIGLSVFAFYPPDQKIKLGLDLKGGVHLVLRVQTDDALRLETETTSQRLGEKLKTGTITVTSNTVTSAQNHGRRCAAGRMPFRALTETEVNHNRSRARAVTFTLKPNIIVNSARTRSTRRCRPSSAE